MLYASSTSRFYSLRVHTPQPNRGNQHTSRVNVRTSCGKVASGKDGALKPSAGVTVTQGSLCKLLGMSIFFVSCTPPHGWRPRKETTTALTHVGSGGPSPRRALQSRSAGALGWTRGRTGRGAAGACALGRGRALLPARGPRRSREWRSCCARWGAGTCRLAALHAEARCLRDRALPGTSAWWEPKEGRWRARDTNVQRPPKPTSDSSRLLSDPAAGVPEK